MPLRREAFQVNPRNGLHPLEPGTLLALLERPCPQTCVDLAYSFADKIRPKISQTFSAKIS